MFQTALKILSRRYPRQHVCLSPTAALPCRGCGGPRFIVFVSRTMPRAERKVRRKDVTQHNKGQRNDAKVLGPRSHNTELYLRVSDLTPPPHNSQLDIFTFLFWYLCLLFSG